MSHFSKKHLADLDPGCQNTLEKSRWNLEHRWPTDTYGLRQYY